jgi:hypothetical protein
MDKKNAVAAFLTVMVLSTVLWASPRNRQDTLKTYREEGDSFTPFATTCSSTTWTALATAPTGSLSTVIQRSLFVQNLAAINSYNVCVSSSQGSATCANATTGIELAPGSNATIYGEATYYCRARSPSTGEILKGILAYDSRD